MTTLLRVLTHRASLPLWCVVLLLPSLTWGQQELRSGKKGATDPAPVTSTSIDANHQALDVNVAGGSLGDVTISNVDGAITDGANNTIKATVLDLTSSNPVTTAIVDASGNQITSFGGGTEVTEDAAAAANPTGKMDMCRRRDTLTASEVSADSDVIAKNCTSKGEVYVKQTDPVAVTGTFWQATQPVSGTFWQATQPVSGSVSITQGGNTAAVNASSQLSVNCANCSGSGVSQQDNTGFTPGTTNFVPMGGEVDDTGTTAVTENNAGVARITAQRAVHMNLRNNSGTEIGTSGNPLVVGDGSGAMNVIVDSGTISISQTSTANDVDATVANFPTTASTSAISVRCVNTAGNAFETCGGSGGSGGTSSNFGSAFPTPGTAAGFTDGTNMVAGRVVTSTPSAGDAGLVVRPINPNLAADNSTLSTAKVPVIAGTVSTSAPTWTNGNQSALSLQTDGSVRAAITNTPTVTANAGTNLNTSALLTTSAHDAAFGTAGTADTQVRTIQGIAGMTAVKVDGSAVTQPVSGTITANAGTGSFTVAQATGTNLHVVCDSGCSSSSGFADNGAFTFGTTAINPIGGVFDDTSPNTATENSAAIARITQNKALHMNLRNASGTEIGTSSNAVRTDPTGTTPQPATQSGTWTVQPGNTANTTAWLMKTADPCTSGTKVFLPISQATSTQLLTGTASNRTYVCSIVVTQPSASTQTFSLVNGTGTVCATSTAAMIGATTAANGMQLPFSHGSGSASVAKSTVNADNVCLLQSSTDRIAGVLSYVVAP